jgi:hypothetical protein
VAVLFIYNWQSPDLNNQEVAMPISQLYPKLLQPDSYESHTINGEKVQIPVVHLEFKKWQGEPIADTFGGKGLIDYEGIPMFAELVIMKTAIANGWQARWIEAYAMKGGKPYHFSAWGDGSIKTQIQDPIQDQSPLESLELIASQNSSSFYGCWDVIIWSGERVIYIEAKRIKQDRMRITQDRWLESGLKAGLDQSNFVIAWWDFV